MKNGIENGPKMASIVNNSNVAKKKKATNRILVPIPLIVLMKPPVYHLRRVKRIKDR